MRNRQCLYGFAWLHILPNLLCGTLIVSNEV